MNKPLIDRRIFRSWKSKDKAYYDSKKDDVIDKNAERNKMNFHENKKANQININAVGKKSPLTKC
ncbi:hypothetical protein NS303_21995 [Pantoea ananatis]|uniref:hypothetical protein n=1 Tax=Pantoea ananas TaxID=553 RepID=UPI000736DC8F|nr:hypothetical protein [Pantoea ananatis]KTR44755.1 hypothetical protein NS303_21995 [Pantoea ananatis]KTR46253.1 hypothetical protein NS311_22240 [Pantoea ananatis]KTR64596.1 hypothetical protein RSA47_11680 [Pantoea ananatis]KTR67435.1 hypothetical protein NS296_22140 [Pantoea ananatis]